jgi:hypothetical protein
MMKAVLVSVFFMLVGPVSHGQYNPVASMQTNFKEVAAVKKNSPALGSMGIQSYVGDAKGSQFYFPVFLNGSATTVNNEVFAEIYFFLFDKTKQDLYIIKKDDHRDPPEILLVDKSKLRSFTIIADETHEFVPARFYDPGNSNDFYELLKRNDSAYSLLKSIKTEFVKVNNRDYERVRTGHMTDEFVDKIEYYISYKMGKPQPVKFLQRNVLNVFPASKRDFIRDYFVSHSQDEIDEKFMASLVDTLDR